MEMNCSEKNGEGGGQPRQLSKSPGNDQITAYRRRQIAALRLRGMTLDEIVKTLATLGVVNPDTQKPFGRTTVHNDLRYLEAQWRDETAELHELHKARVLAELRELRRAAWQDKKFGIVLRGLQAEADMFGLNAPITVDLPSGVTGDIVEAEAWHRIADEMTIEELEVAASIRDRLAKYITGESVSAGSDEPGTGHPQKQTS